MRGGGRCEHVGGGGVLPLDGVGVVPLDGVGVLPSVGEGWYLGVGVGALDGEVAGSCVFWGYSNVFVRIFCLYPRGRCVVG